MRTIIVDGVQYKPVSTGVKNDDGRPYCIVRCRNAGVHAGYVVSRTNGVLTLHQSRRMWRWWSTGALSALAIDGPRPDKLEENKYEQPLPILHLTESDVCEVIPCSAVAADAIQAVPIWVAS